MRLAVVQTNPIFGEVRNNVQSAIRQMENVDADLFVLPELFNTGYNYISKEEVEQLAETTDGFTFQEMFSFAKKKNCFVVYGFAELEHRAESLEQRARSEERGENLRTTNHDSRFTYYNSSALVGPNGMIGIYRKVHLFYRENIFFSPGNLGFPVFDLPFGTIGMMICFDWYFPESARTLALQGAQLICQPANLVMSHCPDSLITRCLENRVFAALADRVGDENRGGENLHYIGKSEIVTPKGEILIRLGENEANIAVAEIDVSLANDKQLNEYNNLFESRRSEMYKF
ncbi:MAG: acyltransferase [Ignavibacteria bacterium]|nr:acyltransferase [Ignavibacteria bacterium]